MRKKTLIIPIAIIALIAFGSVSSAHAFVDPVSLSAILAAGFLALVTANEVIKHNNATPAKEQTKTPESKQKLGDSSLASNR